jgi:hypothetical protein
MWQSNLKAFRRIQTGLFRSEMLQNFVAKPLNRRESAAKVRESALKSTRKNVHLASGKAKSRRGTRQQRA